MAAKISQTRTRQLKEKNQIQLGYAAFNARDGATLGKLLHPDVEWHDTMTGTTITGRKAVVAYLLALPAGILVELIDVASLGKGKSVTLDVIEGMGPAHACADMIEFDGDLIKTVWFCEANTHAPHDHPGH